MTAPGKAQRTGISLPDLFLMFPDDATAQAWFERARWGGAPWCPHCGSTNVQSGAKHKTMPYRCRAKDCAKRFSARIGTPLEASKLGYQTWAIAMYLITTSLKGVSSMKLHRDLGIGQKAAWHLAHRIREAWGSAPVPFHGPVEADETMVRGRERNKHPHQKLHENWPAGKTTVAGVKDRATNRVSAAVVPATDARTLKRFVAERTAWRATVYTDDHPSYAGLPHHQTVKHSVGEYVNAQAHTNGIESFWSMLKRGLVGTYHQVSAKHLQRYVDEFTGRHNLRDLNTLDQMTRIACGLAGKRLPYRALTA